MESIQYYLMLLVDNIFPLLTAVAGIVVAILLWKRAPRSALLLLIAIVLQFLLHLASNWFFSLYLPLHRESYTATEWVRLSTVIGIGTSVLYAADYGLLIWAIAAGRRMPSKPPALPVR